MHCRVWVRDIMNDMASVHYIDYGNEDDVPLQQLCQLPDNCWDYRPLVVPCRAKSLPSPADPGLLHHKLLKRCDLYSTANGINLN